MNYNLKEIILRILFVIIFGGWVALINLVITMKFILILLAIIAVTFFKTDMIISFLEFLFGRFGSRRRY